MVWFRSRSRVGCRMPLMSRRHLAAAALVVAWGSAARAEDAAPAATPEPAAAVQRLAETLAGQVGRLAADMPRARMDLAVVIHSELPPRGEGRLQQLPEVLQDLVIGTVSRAQGFRSVRAASGAEWADRDAARRTAAGQGTELLLWLDALVEQNHLVIRGTLFDTERHVWREAVEPEQRVIGEVFARARVDAELRWYLGALPRRPLVMTSVALEERIYLGLAVADLDGDDRTELVLLSPRSLEIYRLGAAQVAPVAQLRFTGLPRAATRSRDPVGTLVVGPRGADGSRPVALRTSDQAQGLVASFDGTELQLVRTLSDFPIRWENELLCTTLRPGRSAFETAPTPCDSLGVTTIVPPFVGSIAERVPRPATPPASLDVTALADGMITLAWDDRPPVSIGPHGTALAVTDVEDDGLPEVLLSSDGDPWTGDELTVVRPDTDGAGVAREAIGRVDGSVWVAGAGDIDDDGLRELLAISQAPAAAELLVIE